jgi:serine/threonine protein kinase
MLAGESLLHYRLVEKIGEGGRSVVWKAVDTTLDREVGGRFYVAEIDERNWQSNRIDIVLNWFDDLHRLTPE